MRATLPARHLRIACRTITLLTAAAAAAVAAQPARPELHAGATLEHTLAGGETHAYGVEAGPETRLLVTAEQEGIDVVLELRRPDGRLLLAVDSPTDSRGPESALIPAEASGPLEVRVLSPSPGVAPGTYSLRLEELAAATPADRERIDAERLMTEAAARNREGGAEGKRLAAARYEEAAVRWRALGNRREEARCALATGGVALALGQPKQALERYQQALDLSVALTDEPEQAAAWNGVGLARTALGDTAGAIEAQRRALDLEHGLGHLYEEGKALNNLGFALHTRGDLREALGYYRQALDALHQAGEKGFWEANVLHNLASIYIGLGEPEAALASHRQVLERQRVLGDRRGEARTFNNLGVLENDLGEPGKALEDFAPALAIFRQSGDRLWEAALLHNRGNAYYALGDFQHALADLEQALAIRHEAGDAKGEVRTTIAIGQTRLRLGRPEETVRALDLGRRAAGVASAASDANGEMLARRLLGQAALDARDPAAALPELARALDLARALEDRLDEASILQLTGEAYLASKQPESAARVLSEAVDLARAVRTPARIVGALTALARAERSLGRPEEARSRVEEALGLVETLRARETDPDLRASFLAAQRAAFELEIDLLMELDRRRSGQPGQPGQPGNHYAREALAVSERAHARSLLDLLQEAHADIRQGVDRRLRERERALLVRLDAKAGRQADLLSHPESTERRRHAEDEIRSVLDELARVEAEIRRNSPRYAALTQPPLATSRAIQALLDGETLLLEYSLGEERSFLWAIDRNSIAGFELPPRARIEAAAREAYERLGVLEPGAPALERTAASLSRLSGMLIRPVARKLGKRRLVVVADGELQYIPFGALPAPGGSAPLLAEHEIVNVPSASTLALQRRLARRKPAPGAVAVLADPVFGPEDPRVTTHTGTRSGSGFARLPWTRREAEAIAAVVPPGRSLLALGFRASRATVLSPAIAGYRIVHFATHGIIDARTPALSGLMLSRVDERGAPLEGFLGLRDIYGLRLGADLVVLSGCETALGQQVRGEGLVGLTQAFLYTGAKGIVASLWRIEDRATAELMSRFYRGLLVEGRTPAAALRAAQLAIRADKRWRSPYYWSGFVLQGDWTGSPAHLR
jgi:CHAT domain-containing protein/tetratricopeptide (TPR) repeat protein